MSELLFPAAAIGVTFLVLIPILTLLSFGCLRIIRRRTSTWVNFGSNGVIALLLAPTLLPLLWLTSSVFHQTEPHYYARRAFAACQISHEHLDFCSDAVFLSTFLLVGLTAFLFIRYYIEIPRNNFMEISKNHPISMRIEGLISKLERRAKIRYRVIRRADAPIYTTGIFRCWVMIDADFAKECDDAELRSALLHELAHIRHLDIWYTFLARQFLMLNPLKNLLIPDFERWKNAREAVCDVDAVEQGGDPLALASGLIHAAKLSMRSPTSKRCPSIAAHFCGHSDLTLKLRVALLLDTPQRPLRSKGHYFLLAAIFAVVLLPHIGNYSVLEFFHYHVEDLLHLF